MSSTRIENLGKVNGFEFIVSEVGVPIGHLGGHNKEKAYTKSQKSELQSTPSSSHAIYNILLSFPFSTHSPLSIHFKFPFIY